MELRGSKFRSIREPTSYIELQRAAMSLIELQGPILGLASKQSGSCGMKKPQNINMQCAKSLIRIDNQETFDLVKDEIWLKSVEDDLLTIKIAEQNSPQFDICEEYAEQRQNAKIGFRSDQYFRRYG